MITTSIGDPLVGAVLDGRYEIRQRLARGGMATVYRATDTRLSRAVAVKVMHEGLGDDQDFARKFDREARSAAKLNHPNVVAVFDQGADRGRPYIVMEYVTGYTLRNLISAEAPMDPLRALDLIDNVLNALCAAHDGGLVHRDIKPENVLISDRGSLKVADFGLSRAVTSQTATATQGVLIGTVSYLPPELVEHGKADTRSDVYSTGVVLFEMLTGTKPYSGETPIQVAYAHVHNQIPLPSTRLTTSWRRSRAGIPPYVDALVRAATQRDPDRRPSDARAMQDMVRRAMDALAAGVMDDPALTRAFSRGFAPGDDPGSGVAADDESSVDSQVLPDGAGDADSASPLDDLMDSEGASRPRTKRRSRRAAAGRDRRPATASEPHSRLPTVSVPVGVRRRRLAALAVLVVVTLVGTTGWWLVDGRYLETPAVIGIPQAAAEEAARADGLTLHIETAYSETVPAGNVVSTDPAAGADLLRGGTFTAVVSRGPERYPMPKVIGLKRDDAILALTEGNLALGTVNEDWHEELAPGVVTQASAEPGDQLRRDERVDLTLSKGPRPIQVPDVRGRTAKDGQAILERLGLQVVVRTATSPTVPAGEVLAQSPASGVRKKGDAITITRSVGPALVAVPDVTLKPVAEASDMLTRAGFKVVTAPGPGDPNEGLVVRVDPGVAEQIPEGSTVTIYLA